MLQTKWRNNYSQKKASIFLEQNRLVHAKHLPITEKTIKIKQIQK
jgi:hypothetical protein